MNENILSQNSNDLMWTTFFILTANSINAQRVFNSENCDEKQ